MKPRIDLPTLAAIAVIAYVCQNVLHEAVGHGGTCLLLGCRPTALSTAYFDMADGSVSSLGGRLVAAGGALANILAGFVCWILLATLRSKRDSLRFFLWLSMTINMLGGTGYLLFSGVTQYGDWVTVIAGFEPFWAWNTLMILIGATTYLLTVRLALVTLRPLVGGDHAIDLKRATALSVYPYLIGSVATTVGAALNPISPLFVLTSAAGYFGGTSGLAWMTQLYKGRRFEPAGGVGIEIRRSWLWIVTGAVVLSMHVFILGPSLTF
jgi:hypothetical protein